MGLQNATVRKLAVPDLPTTVLTLTLIGVPADSQLVGGSGSRAGRRLIAVAAMLLGALIGATLLTHGATVLPLVIATLLVGGVAIATYTLARANPPWVHASPADEAKEADQTDGATDSQEGRNGVKTITVPVEGLNFASCAQSIEKRLGTFSGVREVAASYVTQTATITFDERVMSETTIRELVGDCGFACGETCDPARMLAQAAVSSSATQAPAPSASAVAPSPAHDHVHEHANRSR